MSNTQFYNSTSGQFDVEKLKSTLLYQIEFYFSPYNLSKDFYLVSQMDAEYFVPLSVIAGFPKIRTLTTDMNFIIEVLKTSERLILSKNQKKIKPLYASSETIQRNSVALKDITIQEVQELFQGTNFKNLFAEADTIVVQYQSDKEALDIYEKFKIILVNSKQLKIRVRSVITQLTQQQIQLIQQQQFFFSNKFIKYTFINFITNINNITNYIKYFFIIFFNTKSTKNNNKPTIFYWWKTTTIKWTTN